MRPNESDADERAPENPEDVTLGGYRKVHNRPPAFEGKDGFPYTVSVEIEKTSDLRRPYAGYLVFPRWAETGVGIVGHVVTPLIHRARSEVEAREELERTPLTRVQAWLDEAIECQEEE